ncbi:beta-glucosidase [Frankia sp. EI5c]|uniref:beta-glucosidase family protein n=1 Tax=Frankia sp. EI5c TaxID=683316 RepID=UPI000A0284AC|nr:glycoside hydrolase family 3 N-terminal domain-containing protein [Frankia sp. EI5c]
MTVEEKAQQVTGVLPIGLFGRAGLIRAEAERLLGTGIGHVAPLGMLSHPSPQRLARSVNEIQRFLLTGTRLGIPALFHVEALNGVVSPGLSGFPTAIALAATWNPAGVEEMAGILRRQARAVGHTFVLSPVLDVARDARWGRVHETYGEDPYLVSAMGVAFVRGLQGADRRAGVIATGKHFLGYSLTEAGQNMARTTAGPRELYEVYARPFEAAIRLAGLGAVMNSYSEVDGVPVAASHALLTALLRERLGFTGSVVSDYDAVRHLHTRLGVARDAREAGTLALAAGLDVELPTPYGYGPVLAEAVRCGAVPEEQLDRSVRRVLRDKFALGLFDRPYVDEDPVVISQVAGEGTELSRDLARQSVTLLSNDGTLPLRRDLRDPRERRDPWRIAVVGPHAEGVSFAFPPYTYPAALDMLRARITGERPAIPGTEHLTSDLTPEALDLLRDELTDAFARPIDDYIRAGYGACSLVEALRRAAPEAEVTTAPGCGVLDCEPADIPAAVAVAAAADVVILALGGRAGWFTARITEGEGCDRAEIDLPAHQVALARAVAATGIPCVGIVHSGRPLALTALAEVVPTLLYAYYGGPHAATVLADVLLGEVEPGGRLPVSLPRHSGQVPIYAGQPTGTGYRRTAQDMHRGYQDVPGTPLFPFGHGCGYTDFAYSDLTISAGETGRSASAVAEVDGAGSVNIELTVRNTGERAGDEVVQLYFADQATGVTRPARELVGFTRLTLAAGTAATVRFTVAMSQLGYVGPAGAVILEPGPVQVFVGRSSADLRLTGAFEVVGEPVTLDGRRTYLSGVTVNRRHTG